MCIRDRNFIVQTSVSVASVKGTDFWFLSNKGSRDSVIGLEGIITLSNSNSREKNDIKSGITALSSLDGRLLAYQSDPSIIPMDLTEINNKEKKMEIIFKNSTGEEKTLIIEYK